jgi:hypothetical protein
MICIAKGGRLVYTLEDGTKDCISAPRNTSRYQKRYIKAYS